MPTVWNINSAQTKKKTPVPTETVDDCGSTNVFDYVDRKRQELHAESQQTSLIEDHIKQLEAELAQCTNRCHIRKKLQLEKNINELKGQLVELKSNEKAQQYESAILPYLQEHQRQVTAMTIETKWKPTKPIVTNNLAQPGQSASSGSFCAPSDQNENKMRLYNVIDALLQDVHHQATPVRELGEDRCEFCHEEMTLDTEACVLICNECKVSVVYIDTSTTAMSFNDEVEIGTYHYKRDNHFRDWLTYFQAKESTQFSDEDLMPIMNELYRRDIHNVDLITVDVVLSILKKLKKRGWYKHKTKIWSCLTGKLPPRLTPHEENFAYEKFAAIQAPFEKFRPADRSNFLSYGFVLHKIMQMAQLDDLTVFFPLLKGNEKLAKQEDIWKKICEELKWPYISSKQTTKARARLRTFK